MFRKRLLCLFAVAALAIAVPVYAAQVESGDVYCFTAEDFSADEALTGVCITGLPDPNSGTAMLGSRVVQCGDILTVEQLAQMTFVPLNTEQDAQATVTFLPIYEDRVEKSTTMTVSIKGKRNEAPVAEDLFVETYKNLPIDGELKVTEPEGGAMTYSLIRQPKRGTVELKEDGSFTYTPKKNKVGVDSFVFTATDESGNVSREATVTVRILKPTNAEQYTDTVGSSCRFAAEWMKNTGLFVGEKIGDNFCFQENKPVSRGEFVTMAVKLLNIPVQEQAQFTGYTDEIPEWLKPYLAAALRSGMTAGLPTAETGIFGAGEPITGGEAAVMLQNALDLSVSTAAQEQSGKEDAHWAAGAVTVMGENGIDLSLTEPMTRGQAAQILYRVSLLMQEAPGTQMYQ